MEATLKKTVALYSFEYWQAQGLDNEDLPELFMTIFDNVTTRLRLSGLKTLQTHLTEKLRFLPHHDAQRPLHEAVLKNVLAFSAQFVPLTEWSPIEACNLLPPNRLVNQFLLPTNNRAFMQQLRICVNRQSQTLAQFTIQGLDENDFPELVLSPITTYVKHRQYSNPCKLLVDANGELFLLDPFIREIQLTHGRPIFFCGEVTVSCKGELIEINNLSELYNQSIEIDRQQLNRMKLFLTSLGLATHHTIFRHRIRDRADSEKILARPPEWLGDSRPGLRDIMLSHSCPNLPRLKKTEPSSIEEARKQVEELRKQELGRAYKPSGHYSLNSTNAEISEEDTEISYVICPTITHEQYAEFLLSLKSWLVEHTNISLHFEFLACISISIQKLQALKKTTYLTSTIHSEMRRHVAQFYQRDNNAMQESTKVELEQRLETAPWNQRAMSPRNFSESGYDSEDLVTVCSDYFDSQGPTSPEVFDAKHTK